MSLRTDRIGEQLREEIARVVREELTDPRVGLLTLTRVDVAPDLSNAVVYWSPLEARSGAELEGMAEGLESASGFIRRRLAQILPLRRMPALRFRYDASVEEGAKVLSLLKDLRDERSERESGTGED